MQKLRLDLLCILIFAVVLEAGIRIWGKFFGITTPESIRLWSSVIAGSALLCALVMLFDGWGRLSDAWRNVMKSLKLKVPVVRHAMPAGFYNRAADIDTSAVPQKTPNASPFENLPGQMRARHGWRWHYRQRFLLLTGDNAAVTKLLPELEEQSYAITEDAVLFFARTDSEGQPDVAWLKQLYKLRRRRPIDAVVLTVGQASALASTRRASSTYSLLLARIAEELHWRAPVLVLDLHRNDKQDHGAVVGSEFAPHADAREIEVSLLSLCRRLASITVQQLGDKRDDRYAGELSQRLEGRSKVLAPWIAGLNQVVTGAFFAPFPNPHGVATAGKDPMSSADLPLWRHLSNVVRTQRGRRVGAHPETVLSVITLTGLGIWMTGMLASAVINQTDITALQQVAQRLKKPPQVASRLRALLNVQQEISRFEYRTAHHAPLLTRFGLNRDKEILQALWAPYREASQHLLVAPVQQMLETELIDLAQLRSDQLDKQAGSFALDGHQALKSYLMLAEPPRSDTAFLTPQLIRRWQLDAHLLAGEQRDLGERLLTFYSNHLAAHPDWKITPSAGLVQAARQTLLAAIGVQHADTTLYRHIVTAATDKYPDQTLASLTVGTDPRGLIRNHAIVSGVFTRQAYEGAIAPAIVEAAKRNTVARDWVLTGQAQPATQTPDQSPQALQAALTAQYFAEYAEQWQMFMNNVQWEAAPTMPAAIEQLKLMTDARQSPVIALMKSLQYQGTAGVRQASLSDTLVAKAQDLLTATKATTPPALQNSRP